MIAIDQKLDLLYDVLVDHYPEFQAELTQLILDPASNPNTYKLSVLLEEIGDTVFLLPLLQALAKAATGDTWISDYLYAANALAGQIDEDMPLPDGLLYRLGHWVLDNTGELAWKAATLLTFIPSAKAEAIQLKKLVQEDFFMVHADCLVGLWNYDRAKHRPLIEKYAHDPAQHEHLRALCMDLLEEEGA